MMLSSIARGTVTEGIWRRGWDLNPRYPLRYVRFRGGSFQPLTHLSALQQLSAIGFQPKTYSSLPGRTNASEALANDQPLPTTDDSERTPAATPRCVPPEPRPEPRSYDSVADDSGSASPTAPRLPSDRRRHRRAARCGHAPSHRRTWRTAQL